MLSTQQNPRVLVQNNANLSHTGDLLETTILTYKMPANTMKAQSSLGINVRVQKDTIAGTIMNIKMGGTVIFTSNIASFFRQLETLQLTIDNQNSQQIQQVFIATLYSTVGQSVIDPVNYAVDTSKDLDITFSFQLDNAGGTAILRNFRIMLYD